MPKPTDEQIKKFWEWCGFKKELIPFTTQEGFWEHEMMLTVPSGDKYRVGMDEFPEIDHNNLFKYAVPKLTRAQLTVIPNHNCHAVVCKGEQLDIKSWSPDTENEDPALALFWAIWSVIEEEVVK